MILPGLPILTGSYKKENCGWKILQGRSLYGVCTCLKMPSFGNPQSSIYMMPDIGTAGSMEIILIIISLPLMVTCPPAEVWNTRISQSFPDLDRKVSWNMLLCMK